MQWVAAGVPLSVRSAQTPAPRGAAPSLTLTPTLPAPAAPTPLSFRGWGPGPRGATPGQPSPAGRRSLLGGGRTAPGTGRPDRPSLPGFDRYFSSRTLDNNRRNIWFAEFWEDNFHCKLSRHALKRGSHAKKCTSEHARGGAGAGRRHRALSAA